MKEFTHINEKGLATMVDVGDKPVTKRTAEAKGEVYMSPATIELIKEGKMRKGDVLAVAQIAGITGAKRTSELIPMCHNIFITSCDLDFCVKRDHIIITSTLKTEGQTGIEMEALTAVSVAALTIYDMCKAVDKAMRIENIRLVKKTGGRSGEYKLEE